MWQTLSEHFYERTVWGNLWMCSHLVQPAWWNLGILHFLLLYLHGRNYMNVHDIIYFLSSQTITSFLVFVTIHIIDGACVKMLCKTLLLVVRIYLWCKCCVNGLKKKSRTLLKKEQSRKKKKKKAKTNKKKRPMKTKWKQNETEKKIKKKKKKKKKNFFECSRTVSWWKGFRWGWGGWGEGAISMYLPSPLPTEMTAPPPLKKV